MELFAKKKHTKASQKSIVNKNKIIAISKVSVQLDWFIGLGIFIVVFCGVITWSILEYLSFVDKPKNATEQLSGQEEIINTKQLNRVVADYTAKANRFDVLAPGFTFDAVGEARLGDSASVVPTLGTSTEEAAEE